MSSMRVNWPGIILGGQGPESVGPVRRPLASSLLEIVFIRGGVDVSFKWQCHASSQRNVAWWAPATDNGRYQ